MKTKIAIYLFISIFTALMMLAACAKPKISDVMPPEGVKCKAEIKMPDGSYYLLNKLPWNGADKFVVQIHDNRTDGFIDVEVRIYDCK